MSLKRLILILIFLKLNFNRIQSKETTCLINGQKSLNVVNERFLSFSIDPEILLTGFKSSSTSMELAQHLSPAFIRIAGPSTESIKFSADEKALTSFLEGTSDFTVTPMMWESFNNWIKNANLTPVFAISDKNRTNGVWNPKSALPLLEMSRKNNFTCYWQLGYDCKDKSIVQYKHDLFTLKQALDEHSSNRKYWKIVGSDLQLCLSKKNPELARKTLEFLEDVTDAVIWQEQIGKNLAHFTTSPIPIWLVVPKVTYPITFSSGLLWAKQIGDAAKAGYEVIFRQPSLQELELDTPVYWISLIYKTLMGRNVLEVRSNSLPEPSINIYAHCTKNQDNYSKQGAMTIFVVNNSTSKHTTSLRVAPSHSGSIDVQSYIITSDGEDSANTYINGKKFRLDNLQDGKFQFLPTLRRVRVNKLLNLVSPPKSAAFFVLPGAKIPVCIRREGEAHLLMEKLQQDQNINFSAHSEEADVELRAQIPEEYQKYDLMGQEPIEKYHQRTPNKHFNKLEKQTLRKQKPKDVVGKQEMVKEFRRFLIKKPKTLKNKHDKATKLEIIFTERPAKDQTVPSNIKMVELELTSEEIKRILTDRAKSKIAENNVNITSQELEDILKEAADRGVKNEGTTMAVLSNRKRYAAPNVLKKLKNEAKQTKRQRTKRDINMELLDLKAPREKPSKTISINNQEIEATIRKVGETSEELLKDIEKSSEEESDIFAELASSLEKYNKGSQVHNDGSFRQSFGRTDLLNPREDVPQEELCPGAKYLDERVRFLMEPSGMETFIEEDLKDYHSFHENLRIQKMADSSPNAVWNAGQGSKDLPSPSTVTPQFNMEIGEWNTSSGGNSGGTSSRLVGSVINNGEWEMSSFASEDDEKIKNPLLFETERSQKDLHLVGSPFNYREREANPFASEDNDATVKNPLLPQMERPQKDNHLVGSSLNDGEWEANPFASKEDEKVENPSLLESATPQNDGMWKIDSFSAARIQNFSPSDAVTPQANIIWQKDNGNLKNPYSEIVKSGAETEPRSDDNSSGRNGGKAKISSLFERVRPEFSTDTKKLDRVSLRTNEKLQNPSLSKKVQSGWWKINSFPRGNIEESIMKPRTDKELWNMDIFSQKGDGSQQNLPLSETVTTLSNIVWEMNAFSPQNFVKTEKPSPWKINTVLSIDKPRLYTSNGIWDTLYRPSDGDTDNSPADKFSQNNKEKLENASSADVVSSWRAFSQENDENIEDLTSKPNEVSKIDKPFSEVPDFTPSSKIETFTEKTFKDLENYFCDPKHKRFKRDESDITKDDIKNYKKFMIEQLRIMKKARQSKAEDASRAPPKHLLARSKPKLPLTDSKDDNSSSNGEHLHIVIGKPYDGEKLHINERRRAKQVHNLKQRLENRKKFNDKIRERKLLQNEVAEEDEHSSSRRKRTPYNIYTNEVSDTKKQPWKRIGQQYQRRIFRPKTWKPQDMFKLKKVPSYSIEVVDKREFLQRTAPFAKNKFGKAKSYKRSVSNGIDSSENAIEDNPPFKNKKFTKFSKETEINLSTQNWNKATTKEINEMNTVKLIKTSEIFDIVTTPSTHSDSVTFGKTDNFLYDHSQKPQEKVDVVNTEIVDAIIHPQFIDMIMDAVNSTVSSFVHLSEKISKQFSF